MRFRVSATVCVRGCPPMCVCDPQHNFPCLLSFFEEENATFQKKYAALNLLISKEVLSLFPLPFVRIESMSS